MTISFRCPHCNALCAFMDKYAGRRAKCVTCQKKFIIPAQSDIKPEKVIEKIKIIEKPRPGFYKAVFIESWAAIFYPATLATLKYLVMLVVLRLVLGGASAVWGSTIRPPTDPFGAFFFLLQMIIMVTLLLFFCGIWGRIIELYMDVISDTGFDIDQLPPPLSDSDFPLWQHMLKPFLVFIGTMLVAFMPYFLGDMYFMYTRTPKGDMFAVNTDLTIILLALWLISFLSVPSALIHISISRDWMCLRPDFIFKPMLKSPVPYFMLVLMSIGVFYIEDSTNITGSLLNGDIFAVIFKSVLNILAQILILWAMRSAGLYYRHFACNFKL